MAQRNPEGLSESAAWLDVQQIAAGLLGSTVPATKAAAVELNRLARTMRAQLVEGIHRNPALVVYGNPVTPMRGRQIGRSQGPGRFEWMGQLSDDVLELQYRHLDDQQDYFHEFGGGAELYAIRLGDKHALLISDRDGLSLWGEH